MDDDLIKKRGPNDGSDENSANGSQDEDNEFESEERKYGPGEKEKENVNKQKKDKDEKEDEDIKSCEKDEEYRKNLDDLEKLREMREEKKEKDLKMAKDREEKREEEKKKKEKQWEDSDREKKEQKEKLIAGEKVEKKRFFGHKKEEGVFRHKKLANFNTKGIHKINKTFKKVHGVSLKKKKKLMELLTVYNPSKTTLRRNDSDKFFRGFRSKNFKGLNFNRMKKEGIDLKSERGGFSKRDIKKLEEGMTGKENPYKYQRKSSSQRGLGSRSSSSGITTRMR